MCKVIRKITKMVFLIIGIMSGSSSVMASEISDLYGTWTCTGVNGIWDISEGTSANTVEMKWNSPAQRCEASVSNTKAVFQIYNCYLPISQARITMTYVDEPGQPEGFSGMWAFPGGTYPLMCSSVELE